MDLHYEFDFIAKKWWWWLHTHTRAHIAMAQYLKLALSDIKDDASTDCVMMNRHTVPSMCFNEVCPIELQWLRCFAIWLCESQMTLDPNHRQEAHSSPCKVMVFTIFSQYYLSNSCWPPMTLDLHQNPYHCDDKVTCSACHCKRKYRLYCTMTHQSEGPPVRMCASKKVRKSDGLLVQYGSPVRKLASPKNDSLRSNQMSQKWLTLALPYTTIFPLSAPTGHHNLGRSLLGKESGKFFQCHS